MKDVVGSEIAQTLDVSDERARYDAAARKLVAQKSVLAYILKSTLDEFADVPVQKIAEECIEGTPQVSEIAVHQDHPDKKPSGKEKETVLSEEFHIEVNEEISQEVSRVCNLSTGIYNKGKTEGALEMLFSLVKDNSLSVAVAAKRANMEQSIFEKNTVLI